jgi:putative FmdB family regulatory protein
MPLYEYDCPKCQKILEITQKASEPTLTACPECGGEIKKLLSLGSFALKGTGYYSTDYKKPVAPAAKPATPPPAKKDA